MKLNIHLCGFISVSQGSNIDVSYAFKKAIKAYINNQRILPSKIENGLEADAEDTLVLGILKCIPYVLQDINSKIVIFETKDGTKLKSCVISDSRIVYDNASAFRIVPKNDVITQENKPFVYKGLGNKSSIYFPYVSFTHQTLEKHIKKIS
jgi:hypothetical protein